MPSNEVMPSRMPGFTAVAGVTSSSAASPLGLAGLGIAGYLVQKDPQLCAAVCQACLNGRAPLACQLCGPCVVATAATPGGRHVGRSGQSEVAVGVKRADDKAAQRAERGADTAPRQPADSARRASDAGPDGAAECRAPGRVSAGCGFVIAALLRAHLHGRRNQRGVAARGGPGRSVETPAA